MATSRAKQLEKLAANLPGANQQVAQGLQQARQTQLQETVRQAGPEAGTRAAQQIGTQQAQQAGQIGVQAQQQQANQATQLGQMGLQQMGREGRGRAAGQQLALDERQQELSGQLNKIDSNLKNQLLDQQMTFQKDQAGNTLYNERQLMDWSLLKAESKEELAETMAMSNRAHERKTALYKRSYQLIKQELEEQYSAEGHERNQLVTTELEKELNAMELAYKQSIAAEANNKAKNEAMFGTFGAVAGGVVGGIFGGPVGAAAGASAGGALGSATGTLIS